MAMIQQEPRITQMGFRDADNPSNGIHHHLPTLYHVKTFERPRMAFFLDFLPLKLVLKSCPETSVTTSLRCVTSLNSEDLI